jgi:hypothetical protein
MTKDYRAKKEFSVFDMVIIYAIIVSLVFIIIRPLVYALPRYISSAVPFFIIGAAKWIYAFLPLKNKKSTLACFFIIATLIPYFLIVVGDPILPRVFIHATNISTLLTESCMLTLLYLLPLVIVFFGAYLFYKEEKKLNILVLANTLLLISASISVSYLQTNACYSTTYEYGETGLIETARYLQENTAPNETIISAGDVAWYAHRRYYYPDCIRNITKFQKVISENNITYIVIRERFLYESPEMRTTIEQNNYKLIERIGSFNIYFRG